MSYVSFALEVLKLKVNAETSYRNAKAANPSSRIQSPEVNPVATIRSGNPVTSPLLEALSSAAPSTSQNTNEWAKNVPAFSGSPSNLINLGDSPPTLPSSYEDRVANFGWTARDQRIPHNHPSSASPPNRRRPMSYHTDGTNGHGTEDFHSQSSPYAARRSSMYSQFSRYGAPPLPHQAQPHYHFAPDANLMLSPPMPGLVPGENGYYCGFDTLPSTLQDPFKPVENVVITGFEGGLDVYAVTKRAYHRLARIDGLRGGVYNAKILPAPTIRGRTSPPVFVATVVHGPVWTSDDASSVDFTLTPPEGFPTTQTDSARGSPRIPTPSIHDNDSSGDQYQTTVEIYSLQTKQHVTTLLALPKQRLTMPSTNSPLRTPPPSGSLSIHADSNNLVVASGVTGEIWIYRQESSEGVSTPKFRCLGKVWTTLQQSLSTDQSGLSGGVDGDWHATDLHSTRQQDKAPIISLNGRWLAFCPAIPSPQPPLHAIVQGVIPSTRVPGLNSQAPPQLPPINCSVETPGGESMMGKLAQAATQEIFKGAAYIGKQSVQVWNSYWNKTPANHAAHAGHYQAHPGLAHQFPPTHGAPSPAPVIPKDPGLISILDLESLAKLTSTTGGSIHPVATFKVPSGCSFMSFAPSGLALFTASIKGDVQFVWDLMRIQYAKSSYLKSGSSNAAVQGSHVRQIAQFSRMTATTVVDVVWTSPHGERAAMVTEPGTVHVFDLPATAFAWPPPRRRIALQKPGEESASAGLSATGVASNAVNSLWTAARPLVSRTRRSSTGVSTISAASVTSQAGHGTQVLAAGISRSVGAATGRMNEMRKSGSTKLHLPRGGTTPSRACIRLTPGKRTDSVLVISGGLVGFYTVKSRKADRPADKQKASRGAKYIEYRLPSLPDVRIAPEITRDLNQVGDLDLGERAVDSSQPRSQVQIRTARPRGAESSIPQAEIESNAPYQPFHTDRRVGLHVLSHEEEPTPSPSVSALFSPSHQETVSKSRTIRTAKDPWVFGGEIKNIKLDVGPPQNTEDSFYMPSEHIALPASAIERVIRFTDSNEDTDQIIVTTRIKGHGRTEEGFFEDDCEVLDFASQRV